MAIQEGISHGLHSIAEHLPHSKGVLRVGAAGLVVGVGYLGLRSVQDGNLHVNVPPFVQQVLDQVKGGVMETGHQITDKINQERGMPFDPPPPGRSPETLGTAEARPLELPMLREYQDKGFAPAINFRLQEEPSQQREIGIPGPNGIEKKIVTDTFPPVLNISGYVVAKEITPDGAGYFAIEVPPPSGILSPNDMDKSTTTIEDLTPDRNKGKVSGVVVWIKMNPSNKSTDGPIGSVASWKQNLSDRTAGVYSYGPKHVYEYSRIGDPITRGGGPLATSEGAEKALVDDYKNRKNANGLSYEDAKAKYLAIVQGNRSTVQQIIDDFDRHVSLREQLQDKRYVITGGFTFAPFAPSSK